MRRLLADESSFFPLDEERSSGEIAAVVRTEFGISQPAISQLLRALRENGFAQALLPESTTPASERSPDRSSSESSRRSTP